MRLCGMPQERMQTRCASVLLLLACMGGAGRWRHRGDRQWLWGLRPDAVPVLQHAWLHGQHRLSHAA